MKKTCTRLISCVLAALMLITFIPFSASAAQDEPGHDAVSGQADSVEPDSGQSNPNSVNLLSESPTDGAQIDDDAQFIVVLTSKLRSGGSSVMRLKGGGHFGNGSEATVTAYSKKGFSFIGWFDESDSGYADCLSKDQSYTFTVTADVSLVALYERSSQSVFDVSVTGSRFKINEGSVQANSAKFSYNAGERVFISYTDQSMKFLYWENASRNIVSTDKDYSFILVNDVDLNAIYTPVELDDTTALVVFRNAYNQILWTHTYSANNTESIFYPKAPTKMGYVFSEWQLADDYGNPSGVKATDESIRAAMKGNDNVVVVPVYTPVSENTFNITLKFVEDSTDLREPVNYTGTLGDPKNFTAPKIDGKVFLCWKLNGSIVGYDKLYTLIRATNNDVILEAVYGDSEAEKKSFISLTQVFCSKNNDKYVLSHTMQYYIPDNWTMAQAGFLYSRDPEVGASEDSMVITNNSIKRHIIGSTDNRSIYTFNLNTAYPDRVFYVRGYINYKDDLGNLHTDYTDIVAHSYNDINNIRYTVKWLNADGTLLDSDASVPFGAVPVYHGETPTMPASGNTIYTFTGWTPEISEVTGDITYKAVYAETERTFSGPVWNWNGLTEATASFTADDDVSVVQIVNAQISDAVTTQPTCTDSGLRTITATAVFGGNTYTDIKTVEVSALGHDFGEGIVTKSPTCTEKGEETHYCSRCDATVTHEIDALGHNLVHHEAKAATCTEVGYDEYDTCSRCDYTTYNEIPALGHDYKDTVIESDCTESGYTIHTCSRCGDSYTDTPVDALGHNFGDWTVTTAPTCTSKGVETRYCSCCDAFETREVEALGHILIHHDAKAATCTEKGWNAYDTCSRCDYTTYVEIPATGHTSAEAVHENEVAATCTTDGSYDEVVYCSECGEELSRETKTVPALGHDLIHHDAQAATATSVGWEAYDECSRCDYTTYVEIPKLPSVTVTNEEPINNLPVYRYGEFENDPVQTLTQLDAAYKFKSDEPDAATAEYYGNWKADYRVSFNKAVAAESFGLYGAYNGYGNEYSIAFLFPNDISADSPVYLLEAAGLGTVTYNDILNNIKEFICGVFNLDAANSGTEMTVELVIWNDGDPEGGTVIATKNYTLGDTAEIKCIHIWGEWELTTAPTCTEKGEETRYCSRCDAFETREVEALGHDLIHHDAKAATCTEKGWNAYDTCSRCDYTTYLEIPATGHTSAEAVHENEVAATCTTDGSYDEVVYCSVCGEELSRETKTVPALGHDLVHHDAKAATCTEKGWNAYDTCSRCDYTTYVEIPATGHTPAEAVHENEVAATCTSTGSYDEVVYCSECGEELSRETKTIPALGHSFGEWTVTTPATCTESGVETRTCSVCGETETRVISATGHNYEAVVTAPTCTEQGYTTHTCSHCGDSYVDTYVEALGHSFGEWTVTTPATCMEKGEETRYCSHCDAYETREVAALGHDLIHHDAQAATATSVGWEAYDECSRCDYTTYVEIPKLPSVTVTNEEPINNLPVYRYNELDQAPLQTLTQLDAAYKFKSNEPDEDTAEYYGNWKADYRVSFNKAIAAESFGLYGAYNGYGNEYSVAFLFPNDINAGSPVYLLEAAGLGTVTYNDILRNIKEFICGVFNLDAINAGTEMTVELVIWKDGNPENATVIATENYTLGDTAEIKCIHIWGEWELTTAPTCTEKGEETRYCSRCDAYETREVDALGHDLVHHDAKAPTCTEIGWEAYDTCSRCDYTTYVEIPATGHTSAEAVHENEVAATCTSTGSYDEVVYCSVCGEELSRETKTIPALGHDLVHHDAKAATCTEKGWNAYDTCSRCDYTTYVEIPATGHTSAEAVHENEVAATCTSNGSYDEVVYCSVCGEELSRETKTIPALGHDLVHHDAKAPTCTEIGWEAYDTCSRCDYTTYLEIPATGHTATEAVHENEVAATCTSTGSYDEVVYCSVCGEELSRETKTIPALGHDFGDWTVTTAPTCTSKGVETRYCSRCDAFETREVATLGHDLIHHDAKAPTCTENGWEAYDTCSRCDYTTYAELPANGHSFGEWTVTTPATCTEAGVETRTCSVCGETETREISATGHNWNSTPAWTWNGTSSATATFTCDNDNNHKQEVSATITSAEGTGTDKGYTVYTATAEFNNESYTNTKKELITYTITYNLDNGNVGSANPTSYNVTTASFTLNNPTREGFDFAGWTGTGLSSAADTVTIAKGSTGNRTYTATWTPKSANTFTHSDNLAYTDTYLYRVGNGNTVSLGTLFKVNGTGTPDPSNVNIKVESVEANSSVRGTGSNLESGSNAKCTYTKNASDWTSSTLKFTGEGPVKLTISEGSGETYTLNLEVVTGNNNVSGTLNTSSSATVLLGNVSISNTIGLSNKRIYGNGFTIDASSSSISSTGNGIITLNGGCVIDNVVIQGPTYSTYPGSYGETEYSALIFCYQGVNTFTNCRITGAATPLRNQSETYIYDSILSGGSFCNIDIRNGKLVTENVTTVGNGKDLGIVFAVNCTSSTSLTINGTLTQHNFIAQNASMISRDASLLKNSMFGSDYSKYQFSANCTKYVNTGILSMSSNVGAANITDNRSDKKNYEGMGASLAGTNGYVYTMNNSDSSMLETSYTEPAYTPSTQNPYEPVFTWSVPSGDNVAAGGDSHCYKDSNGVLQIQFLTDGSKTINAANYATFIKYQGTTAITPSSITCVKDSSGAAVTVTNGTITFNQAGTYTISYIYSGVEVYDKDLGHSTTVTYTKTISVNVAVKKTAPNAVITSSADTGTIAWGKAGSTYDPDYNPCIPFLDGLTITDYDANGNAYTVLDGSNQAGFISSIASVSVSGTTVTITLANGTNLVVKGPTVDGSVQLKAYSNKLYYCDSTADNNPAAFTKTFAKNSITYTGENGVAVSYGTARSFTSTTSTSTIANYSAMTTPWTSNKFLMFDAQGGTVSPSYTGTSPATLPTPTRDGYTFLNWNTKADGTGTARNAGTSMTFSSTTTLYAIWAENVEVTFISDGSTVSVISGGAGTTNTLPTATQTTQWLEGWYTEDFSGGTKIGNAGASFTVPASDTTYYAHWSPKYAVSYNANGGTVNPDSAIFEGTALILPTPANGSKTFEGWFTAAEGGTKIGTAGDSYVPTTNIELFAQWSDNILVTFDGNGGTAATNSDTYDHVTPITLPNATWAGHQFNGWYTAASSGTKIGDAGDSYTPAEATTLHAQWTAYTVTYDANGGSVSPSSASAGSNGYVTLVTPTRTGYTFNGWYTETSGGTKIGNGEASYTPTANITIHAQWSINSYKVTITASNSSTDVTVNGTTVNNGGSVAYNSVVKVVLSYSQSNSLTFTIKQGNTNVTRYSNEACTTTTNSTAAGTYYFKMPAGQVTINSSSTSGNCVPSGTMVTLADGSKKAVEDLKEDDRVLVFNHETGEFEEQGIIFYEADGVDDYNVVNLSFSDGSVTRLIYEHGYFDLDEMQYVYIREDNYNDYIGHRFAKIAQNDDGYTIESVTLTDAYVTEEHTGCFSFPSVYCLNFIADDFLSMPGGINGMFNFFDYDEDLKYNEASMAADIETYGLMDYSFFEEYMTYEEFSSYPAQYLNVALGKGLMTQEWLEYLISRYVIEKR